MEAELRYRAETVRASILPTYGLSVAGWIYAALTWDEPRRDVLVAIFAVGFLSTFVLARLPMERIVAGPWREAFFVGWSVADLVLIGGLVAADGGMTSPLTLISLFPLLFSSLSYPARSIVIVYAAALSSYAVVGLALTSDPDPARVFVGLAALTMAPFIGCLQVREHERERHVLKLSSRTDALTGLLNHTAFQEQLTFELATAGGHDRSLALMALDIDRFKIVNYRLGQAALRSVAERLRLALGVTPVTVSIGIAVFPEHATEREVLMRHADMAMYASKQRGRDRAATYARHETGFKKGLLNRPQRE